MLQTSQYFKCHLCQIRPKQFTFLLCNHIICGNCIGKIIQSNSKYSYVQCSCGGVTYFDDNDQIMQSNNNNSQNDEKYNDNNNDVNYLQKHKTKINNIKSNTNWQRQRQNQEQNLIGFQSQVTPNRYDQSFQQAINSYNNSRVVQHHNQRRLYPNGRTCEADPVVQQQRSSHGYNNVKMANKYERSTMPVLQVSSVFQLNRSQEQQRRLPMKIYKQSPTKQRYLNNNGHIHNHHNKDGCVVDSKNNNKNMNIGSQRKSSKDNYSKTGQDLYEESLLIDQSNCHSLEKRSSKRSSEIRHINQFSTHQIQQDPEQQLSSKIQQRNSYERKSIKQSRNTKNQNQIQSNYQTTSTNQKYNNKTFNISNYSHFDNNNKDSSINSHKQFQNQMDFLKIIFNKDIEEIQNQFNSILNEFYKSYQKLQDNLRSLYIEKVVTEQSLSLLNIPNIVKKKYQYEIGDSLKGIKDQLFLTKKNCSGNNSGQHKVGHFKRINIVNYQKEMDSSESLSKINKFDNYYQQQSTAAKNNQSQQFNLSHNLRQNISSKSLNNCKSFQPVSEILTRITKPSDESQNNQFKRNSVNTNQNYIYQNQPIQQETKDNSKRIQTQNIHTNIKKHRRTIEQRCQRPTATYSLHSRINNNQDQSPNSRAYQQKKINRRIENQQLQRQLRPSQSQKEIVKKHIVYFSPPLPYCHKHFSKRSKQAKSYLSYIQQLCHQKKMKNSRELFKKSKAVNPHQFKIRD